MERIGLVAYHVALLPILFGVYDVFHISQLRTCISDPDAMLETNQLKVQPNLTIPEHPIRILDRAEKTLRRKTILVVKGLWSGQTERESTSYPKLFA